jgi:hypothetical protein
MFRRCVHNDLSKKTGDLEDDLHESLKPCELSQGELRQQIALYIETAALKPLLMNGVGYEHVAEALLELAIDAMERNRGRLAAAMMVQRATRHVFGSPRVPE